MPALHAPVPFDADAMTTSRIARSCAVRMAREAIAAAERKDADTALARIANACYYADQAGTDDDREAAWGMVDAAAGAIKIHCAIDPANV